MAPPQIREVFSGFAPDLQIDLKGPCTSFIADSQSHDQLAMGPYLELVGGASHAYLSGKHCRMQSVYISLS